MTGGQEYLLVCVGGGGAAVLLRVSDWPRDTRSRHSSEPRAEVSMHRSWAWPVCVSGVRGVVLVGAGTVSSRPGKNLESGSRDQGPLLCTPNCWH